MNRLISGVIFHTFKGTNLTFDVARINDVTSHKRLFRIFDKDKPYALFVDIEIDTTKKMFKFIDINSNDTYEIRYESFDAITDEIQQIRNKQELLKRYHNQLKQLYENSNS